MMKWLDKFIDLWGRLFDWVDRLLEPKRRVDQECRDLLEFQFRFGHLTHPGRPVHLTKRKLRERLECMQEELQEFEEGLVRQDMEEMADALVDLVYFAKGTAMMMGLPWEELWDDVHAANMEKVPGVGKRGHQVDCIKPLGWIPPQTRAILLDHGYRREEFTNRTHDIWESRCFDDPQHL